MKRLGFMPLFERDFVLRWVMSIASAEILANVEYFDFALVNFDPDPERAIRFCVSLKKIQPHTGIIVLKKSETQLPENFCADLVLDADTDEQELASQMQSYMRRSA